jgi:serine/threonine protein kinase
MGVVYRGIDLSGGDVAIKVLRPELSSDPILVARFVQERSILLRLTGPGIVPVRDLVVEGEVLAIVMDLVKGGSLRDYLTSHPGPTDEAFAFNVMHDIAVGLTNAHAAGVIHRDVKPENILIESTASGIVSMLTDFGISGLAEGSLHTRMTSVVGTPLYMAPEVSSDQPVTSAADIYSAGVILYELVSGSVPFTGSNTLAVLRQHSDVPPLRPPEASGRTWFLLSAMLDKDPKARPSAEEVRDLLDLFRADNFRKHDGLGLGGSSDGFDIVETIAPAGILEEESTEDTIIRVRRQPDDSREGSRMAEPAELAAIRNSGSPARSDPRLAPGWTQNADGTWRPPG